MNSLNNEARPVFGRFSHEHPLELTNFSGAGTAVCSACTIQLAGKDHYTCGACPFSLHRPRYNMPELVQHPADTGHDLKLLLTPCFHCRACGHQRAGSSYHCHLCQVQYHSLCLLMPLAKRSHCHPHELHLKFSPPYGDSQGFCCDLCGKPGSDHWLYRCDACEFDIHLSCSSAASAPNVPTPPTSCSPCKQWGSTCYRSRALSLNDHRMSYWNVIVVPYQIVFYVTIWFHYWAKCTQ